MPASRPTLSVTAGIRVYHGSRFAFGPGRAALLEEIDRTGSIGAAAKAMGMSYMKAWKLVQGMDRGFTEALVRKTRGGTARGGATLSPTGRKVLALYREMEAATEAALRGVRGRFQRHLR